MIFVSRLQLQQNPGTSGKRAHIIFVKPHYAYSWYSAVSEGLSRRTARARVVGEAGQEVARGAAAAAAAVGETAETRVRGNDQD